MRLIRLIGRIGLIGKRSVTLPLVFLVFLTLPSFWRMLKPGIFSMHDFHVFRMFEFHKCILDFQIPCRWAPDASFGYGQPLFNFYNQLVYLFGEPFVLMGVQFIDTVKILFVLSLILSGISMFFLAQDLWKSRVAGFVAAILYVYAPYRAVDVWVRGALPEAFAFVFFPLIVYFFNRYVLEERKKNLWFFSVVLAGLLLTHNLSFMMFVPFFAVWAIYFLTTQKKWSLLPLLILAGVLSFGVSAFYLLPVFFERKFISLSDITSDYYNFQIHFVSLRQLFLDRTWGYAASQWLHDEELSFSVGHVQWVLSLVLVVGLFFVKKIKKNFSLMFIVGLGFFALFLTHGRSLFLWMSIPGMTFVQFPWRFLSMGVFWFALAGGFLTVLVKSKKFLLISVGFVVGLAILMNSPFFIEDIWYSISDEEEFSGERWLWHRSSAVSDFWPVVAKNVPASEAPQLPVFIEGEGVVVEFEKGSNFAKARVVVDYESAYLRFPIVYFPGWRSFVDDREVPIGWEGEYAGIATWLSDGEHEISLRFGNTRVRTIANLISVASLTLIIFLFIIKRGKW